MAIILRTLFADNISTRRDVDIQFGARGGVLIALRLVHQPRDYHNLSSASDRKPKLGDIHALVLDSATSRSVIGQIDVIHPTVDSVIVPLDGDWDWEHPERDFLESSNLIGRLAFNSVYTSDPIGVIRGSLRLRVEPDPNNIAAHSLSIEAKFMSFDSVFA